MFGFNKNKHRAKKLRFEIHASRVLFDPESSSFVVTWNKCNVPESIRLKNKIDPNRWIPSIYSIATLYDRGRIPQSEIIYAAKAIGNAWSNGDRYMIDTESAKEAVGLVSDLSILCHNSSENESVCKDLGQAIRRVVDELAVVQFMNSKQEQFDKDHVMGVLDHAIDECFSREGFPSWNSNSQRRLFMFKIHDGELTNVVYTLLSLLFDVGICPLLSLSDKRIIRMKALKESGIDKQLSPEATHRFFDVALDILIKMKNEGRNTFGEAMTQQQLADSISY